MLPTDLPSPDVGDLNHMTLRVGLSDGLEIGFLRDALMLQYAASSRGRHVD